MDRKQRETVTGDVGGWAAAARQANDARLRAMAQARAAADSLRARAVPVGEGPRWQVLPLGSRDAGALHAIAGYRNLPVPSAADAALADRLTGDVAAGLAAATAVGGLRRLVSRRPARAAADAALDFLATFHRWGVANGIAGTLQRLAAGPAPYPDPLTHPADPRGGLVDYLHLGGHVVGMPAAELRILPAAVAALARAGADEAEARAEAVAAGHAVREADTRALVSGMPVERLRDVTRERLRTGALTAAGITTVQAVLDNAQRLAHLPGIGSTSAARMIGAAQTLRQGVYEEMPTRIDLANRGTATTTLLRRLAAWDVRRRANPPADLLARARTFGPLVAALPRDTATCAVFAPSAGELGQFGTTVAAIVQHAAALRAAVDRTGTADPWEDFQRRPADYFALLAELGFLTEDERKTHGDLADDLVDTIRRYELDTSYLTASLRGYQSFAARFALVQRKVIIGDEMGLGKTVEALAVLAHLRAKGSHHQLVVCPAAVVSNWVREIAAKSTLAGYRLHGPERDTALRQWRRAGGVAVTTFETLRWLAEQPGQLPDLAAVVVDEAHYIKNPQAQRSQRTARLLDVAPHAVLLTGTPLENHTGEFRNLVGYLHPRLAAGADELHPRRFRAQVAPAYLRRNQEDVLTELPELVEVAEWLPMSGHDHAAYRQAVADGNFMAMRQAAMRHGHDSAKVARLVDIVGEAEENGRRVIVFSYFRRILDDLARLLPGKVFGPLNGSVPAAARQDMVDRFGEADAGAVLVAQISAGGVGLNIQSASVVIICEPQLKPTTEWQAIARARRMGQLQSVQVHRLLSEEGVDERLTAMLARKTETFEAFARDSDTAASAPEAYDVSEATLAREVIAAERQRLFPGVSPARDSADPTG